MFFLYVRAILFYMNYNSLIWLLPVGAFFASCSDQNQEFLQEEEVAKSSGLKSIYLQEDLRWDVEQTIRYSFFNGTPGQKIVVQNCMNNWMAYANIKFKEVPRSQSSELRIEFINRAHTGKGYFMAGQSRVGTTAINASQSEPTMCIYGDQTEAELQQTCLHELGHVLGLIDQVSHPLIPVTWDSLAITSDFIDGGQSEAEAAKFYSGTFGHDAKKYANTIICDYSNWTKWCASSIMMYKTPARWNKEGIAYKGGSSIDHDDISAITKIYPYKVSGKQPFFRYYTKNKNAQDNYSSAFFTPVTNITPPSTYSPTVKVLEDPYMSRSILLGYLRTKQDAGTVPLYLYGHNGLYGTYPTKVSTIKKEGKDSDGWYFQGIIAYVYKSAGSGRVGVHHFQNGERHIYVTDTQLADGTAHVWSGFVDKGIEFYIEKY